MGIAFLGGIFGLLFTSVGIVSSLVFYILFTIPLYIMGKKTSNEYAWLAFVPIANAWLMCNIAGKDWWWLLVNFVPFIGTFIFLAVVGMGLAETFDLEPMIGLVMIVPLINILFLYYLAFGTNSSKMYRS